MSCVGVGVTADCPLCVHMLDVGTDDRSEANIFPHDSRRCELRSCSCSASPPRPRHGTPLAAALRRTRREWPSPASKKQHAAALPTTNFWTFLSSTRVPTPSGFQSPCHACWRATRRGPCATPLTARCTCACCAICSTPTTAMTRAARGMEAASPPLGASLGTACAAARARRRARWRSGRSRWCAPARSASPSPRLRRLCARPGGRAGSGWSLARRWRSPTWRARSASASPRW